MSSPEDNPADEQRAGKCERCDGTGEAIGADRPFEWSGPGTYPGPCPECGGTGLDGRGAP